MAWLIDCLRTVCDCCDMMDPSSRVEVRSGALYQHIVLLEALGPVRKTDQLIVLILQSWSSSTLSALACSRLTMIKAYKLAEAVIVSDLP